MSDHAAGDATDADLDAICAAQERRAADPVYDIESLEEPYRARLPAVRAFFRRQEAFTDATGIGRPRPPRLPGVRISRWLGAGGCGAVYLGTDALGREVAVKVLLPAVAAAGDAVARFEREARITARLNHPGVPPVYHFGPDESGRPCLVMKYVEGRPLSELSAEPGFAAGAALGVFERVCEVVAFAHAGSYVSDLGRRSKPVYVHRDLKPGNVMVGPFGEVYVTDWGLAREADDHAAAGAEPPGGRADTATAAVGTPLYMSPEQARREAACPRADVFSLGAILCEILTGRPPYADAAQARDHDVGGAFARLEAVRAAEPRRAQLAELARRCLSVRAGERPADAGEVLRLFRAWREDLKARDARDSRSARRNRLIAAAAVVAAFVALAWVREAGERAARDKADAVRAAAAYGAARVVALGAVGRQAEKDLAEAAAALRTFAATGDPRHLDDPSRRELGELTAKVDSLVARRAALERLKSAAFEGAALVGARAIDAEGGARRGVGALRAAFAAYGAGVGDPEAFAADVAALSLGDRHRLVGDLALWAMFSPEDAAALSWVVRRAGPDPRLADVLDAHLAGDEACLVDLAECAEPGWHTSAVYRAHAEALVERRRFAEAGRLLDHAMQHLRVVPYLHLLRGRVHLAESPPDTAAALRCFRAAGGDDNAVILTERAALLREMCLGAEADRDFAAALRVRGAGNEARALAAAVRDRGKPQPPARRKPS